MIFLADECLNGLLVADLRQAGFDVQWVRESHPGLSDPEVIELAKSTGRTLISEDKDFGEWVFSHGVAGLNVIFIRYTKREYEAIRNSLLIVLNQISDRTDDHSFITITAGKIRRRNI